MPFHWGVSPVAVTCDSRAKIPCQRRAVSTLAGARVNRWISKSDTTARSLPLQVTGAYHFCGILLLWMRPCPATFPRKPQSATRLRVAPGDSFAVTGLPKHSARRSLPSLLIDRSRLGLPSKSARWRCLSPVLRFGLAGIASRSLYITGDLHKCNRRAVPRRPHFQPLVGNPHAASTISGMLFPCEIPKFITQCWHTGQ